jgi:hypothetical protein
MAAPIWGDINLELFYEDLEKVKKKCNKLPGYERAYDHSQWKRRGNDDGKNRLTFDEEVDWVSDLAFLAAAGEGAGTVSAFVVEERLEEKALKSYGAANEGISDQVEAMIWSILDILTECAQKSEQGAYKLITSR